VAFHAPEPIQGFSFGFTYNAEICSLEDIVYTGDELSSFKFGPYWVAVLDPPAIHCLDHTVAGGVAGAVFSQFNLLPADAGYRVELVFSVAENEPGCCRLGFVDCLEDPPVETVIVTGGLSHYAGIVGGEGCFGPVLCSKPGDVNRDDTVNISDPICLLIYLFGDPDHVCKRLAGVCPDSADSNGDGAVDIADPIFLLRTLFPVSD
jgi:hypothetical protein